MFVFRWLCALCEVNLSAGSPVRARAAMPGRRTQTRKLS
jgi:hypothetical protein